MDRNIENEIGYQFSADPTNLMACCDKNCRSMLWTLVQLASYYADKDGWFFRTNEDLKAQSDLGEKVVRACLSTFYKIGILEVKCIGKGKGKVPNYFKLNTDKFREWENISLEDCYKNPKYKIETDDYKAKGGVASYLNDDVPIEVQQTVQSADNIDNINNKENKLFERSKQIEIKKNQFEIYKKREDELMDKLYHVSTWIDFKTLREQITELISTATSDKIADKTKKRFKSIEEGKIKFLKNKICKEPYNSYYDDFYTEFKCGWLGKEEVGKKQIIVQPQQQEEDDNVFLREMYEQCGWDIPDSLKPKKPQQEDKDFNPFKDEENLPF